VKTSFVGPLSREGCSTLDHSITSLSPRMVLPSLGRVFDGLRFLGEWPLFAWLAILGKILTMDNLRKWQVIVVD
jgi:hypothetical protein